MPSNKDMITRVDADISPLKKALTDAGVYVDQWATRADRSISKLSDSFLSFGRGAVAGAVATGIAAITASITSAVSEMGELADTAERIGVLTDELQVLRFAGISVGVAIETTDDSLTKFVKNVGEAQQGSGALYDITKQYGIALTDSNGKVRDATDILGDLADVVQTANSAQERLRITTDAFGKQGAKLVPILSQGKEGLSDFKKEAIDLGVVIDEETIRKADEFGDAWDKATYRVKVTAQANLGEWFVWFANELENSKRNADAWANYIRDRLRHAYVGVQQSTPQGGGFSTVDLSAALAKNKSDLENFAGGNGDGMDGFLGTLNRSMNNLEYTPSPFPDSKKGKSGKPKLTDEQKDAQKEINKLLEMQNTLKMAGVDLDSQSVQSLNAALETTQAQSQAQQLIKSALEDQAFASSDLGQKLKQQLEEIGDTGRDVANDLGLVFSSAFEEAIASGGDLKSVLQGLLGDIAKIAARKMVTEPLGNFLGDVFKNIKFANGGIMTSRGAVPLRAYSGGGIANTPQLAMFGEGSMPEAYVPLPDGRSIPVRMRGNGGDAITIHQNYTFDARGADPSVMPRLQAMLDKNKKETIDAVALKVGRGGSYAKKLGKR